MTEFKKFITEKGLTIKQVSDRFGIPYRTCQNWASGQRDCADYIIKMMSEIMTKEKNHEDYWKH